MRWIASSGQNRGEDKVEFCCAPVSLSFRYTGPFSVLETCIARRGGLAIAESRRVRSLLLKCKWSARAGNSETPCFIPSSAPKIHHRCQSVRTCPLHMLPPYASTQLPQVGQRTQLGDWLQYNAVIILVAVLS